MTRPFVFVFSGALALSCSRGAEPAPGPDPVTRDSASAASSPTGVSGPTVDLAKLGLKAAAPADTVVEDAIVGDGVMLRGPGVEVSIEEASASRPGSLEEARKDVELYAPRNVQVETLADGFVLTFEAEGGMGLNYWLAGRRTLGDKTFWCETNSARAEARAGGLAACKGLTR